MYTYNTLKGNSRVQRRRFLDSDTQNVPVANILGQIVNSHTFLTDNHVKLHSSQNASYTEDVCDIHLRLTAKPHLCVICSTFHT